jgi:hypothetical protein
MGKSLRLEKSLKTVILARKTQVPHIRATCEEKNVFQKRNKIVLDDFEHIQ